MPYLLILLSIVTSQCAIKLATGLKVNSSVIIEMTRNCCSATGITCNSDKEVVQIKWGYMGLTGTIDESAFPPNLDMLSLKNNAISGNLPSQWPRSLSILNLDNNMIKGPIIALPLQSRLVYLSNNQFSGVLPTSLPSGLSEFYINGNSLTGTVPFLSSINKLHLGYINSVGNTFSGVLHLNSVSEMFLNGNSFTDVVLDNPSSLSLCDISGNKLLKSTHMSDFNICTKNGLTSPSGVDSPITTPAASNASSADKVDVPTSPAKIQPDQAKTSKLVQTSTDNSKVSDNISTSTIVSIVAVAISLFALLVMFYYFRQNKQKGKDFESNDLSTMSFSPKEAKVESKYNASYSGSDATTEIIPQFSLATNSAFFSKYYGTFRSEINMF